ncbi:MAG: MaoC/PaaZ C-terminal domain-containing protein [Propionibacteriaceae bacterium]|nr:hypothetical protein [Micropruina sp.]HBX80001.1 hypothetical protein [Propionibacteriaceae bacterium]HBY24925.1 hypothetical protein [Propionibacteriaceae bacterium]
MALVVLPAVPDVKADLLKALGTSFGRKGAPGGLPEVTAVVRDVTQDRERLAGYDRVCGFRLRDQVSATWLHVLTFPLQTHLMARRDFPFPLPGVLHVSNSMTQYRPVLVSERLDLSVRAADLAAHRRGVAFDFLAEIHSAGELVWQGSTRYLAPGAPMDGLPPVSVDERDFPVVEGTRVWRLPADLGRQYARVSKDANPIHTSTLAAKALGLPRTIIHGMWTHAAMLAALDQRLPDAFTVDVRFTKPVLLPSKVRFGQRAEDGGWWQAVTTVDGLKPFVLAHIQPLKS